MFQERFLTVLFGAVMSITVPSSGFSPERSGNHFKKKKILFFKVNRDIWINIYEIFLVIINLFNFEIKMTIENWNIFSIKFNFFVRYFYLIQ